MVGLYNKLPGICRCCLSNWFLLFSRRNFFLGNLMLVLPLFRYYGMAVFISFLLLLHLVSNCFFAHHFLGLSMLLGYLATWKVQWGYLFLTFLDPWFIFRNFWWNLVFLWQILILRSVGLLMLILRFMTNISSTNLFTLSWLYTLRLTLLHSYLRKASIDLVMGKIFLIGKLNLHRIGILCIQKLFWQRFFRNCNYCSRNNILHCNWGMDGQIFDCFSISWFNFFLFRFYIWLYFFII